MAELHLIGVSKDYGGGHLAVDDLTLEVADREFVVIVGPSGCGKSTTLRLVAGIESESAGEIRIAGRRVNELSPGARDLAMVFQDYALYPHMDVARNIGFGLRRRGMARDKVAARVREVAQMLEIEALLDRRPAALSGGQRQRVAMGRAMVRRPQLFLFDEPLSNLDARLRVSMRAEIRQMQARLRTTTLYVTHDQTEAMTMADRVVVMNQGRIAQSGTPMDIYRRPANLFVAGFIGSPAMNLLDATLAPDGADLAGGPRLPLPAQACHGQTGRQVVLGFRPEAVALSQGSEGIEARVEIVEPIGQEIIVEFSCAGTASLRARLPPDTDLGIGDQVRLALAADQAHIFDASTGVSLSAARTMPIRDHNKGGS